MENMPVYFEKKKTVTISHFEGVIDNEELPHEDDLSMSNNLDFSRAVLRAVKSLER